MAMQKYPAKLLLITALLAVQWPLAQAQRIYTVGTRLDVVGTVDDNPRFSGLGRTALEKDFLYGYAFFPRLSLASRGPNSQLDLSYGFGFNHYETTLDLDARSHEAFVGFEGTLSNRWSMNFSDQFRKSPDFSAFSFLRGVLFTPEGLFFETETVAVERTGFENNANLQLEYQAGPRSTLSFEAGHSLRDFESDPLFRSRYPDVKRYGGSFSFRRKVGTRTGWSLGYNAAQFDFGEVFRDARTHSVDFGIDHDLTPTVSLNLSAGPAYTEFLGIEAGSEREFLGYNARFSISRSLEVDRITLYYQRRSGANIGIGSLSRTHSVGFVLARSLGRSTILNFSTAAYKTDRLADNPYETEGLRSQVSLTFGLTNYLSLGLGASYQTQEGEDRLDSGGPPLSNSFLDQERRSAFVSLQFALPEMWRF